jgi:hypothetical protein
MMFIIRFAAGLATGLTCLALHAQVETQAPSSNPPSEVTWRIIMSPYTLHYRPSEDHRYVYMLGIERQHIGGFVLGASWFRNSFGQPSAYVYAGRRFEHFTPYDKLFAHLGAGVIYGYKPPFNDEVPYNRNGFSPGAVASLGWQFTPMISAQLNFLGTAALMLQTSVDFP